MIMRTRWGEPTEWAELRRGMNEPDGSRPCHITTWAENLVIRDKVFLTPEEGIAALEAAGYEVRMVHDFRGDYWRGTHTKTAAFIAAEEQRRQTDEHRWTEAEQGYVRFGELPAQGKSYNFRDGFYEAGVSCYHAEFLPSGEYRISLTEQQQAQLPFYRAGRAAYRLWGEMVGAGSDGEPLLKVTRCERIQDQQ